PYGLPPSLHPFPTRRSSDLAYDFEHRLIAVAVGVKSIAPAQGFLGIIQHAGVRQSATFQHFQQAVGQDAVQIAKPWIIGAAAQQDRKSTRLNSSHVKISYAV